MCSWNECRRARAGTKVLCPRGYVKESQRFTGVSCFTTLSLMSVFKTYDIRGVWGSEIDDNLAWRIGRGLARFLKAGSFLLGYDARVHSPELSGAIASGLAVEGAKVAGTGLASTPQLHYTQINGGFPAAVMVTASHNPPQYHGFKVFDARGGSLSYDKGLRKVEALLEGIPAPSTIQWQPGFCCR